MATEQSLLTADEYARLPTSDGPTELVRGEVQAMNPPGTRHGEVCVNIALALGAYVEQQGLGRLVSNDGGVITERGPDTVRGADVAYYSFARVPPGPMPALYAPAPPEVVFAVRSPGDAWTTLLEKTAEYLQAGVLYVVLVDDETRSLHVFHGARGMRVLGEDDEFALPDLLGEFRLPVRALFD